MTPHNLSRVAQLERAINLYLAAHPFAADSAIGIQRWWLPEDLACGSVADLEMALAIMTTKGALREKKLPDGNVMYSSAIGMTKPTRS
jgi:hypothetical protein